MQIEFGDKGMARNNRILFVDDEENVTAIMNMMLEGLGFEVTCHADATKAYEDFVNRPDGFSLVICDQVMPGMTGMELAGKVRYASPATPVILCTGYTPEYLENEAQANAITAILTKPFAMQKLARVINSVMDQTYGTSGKNQAA
ncbi:MAG: response regulator [Desulfatibacillum sp.]|nr:response regulator [Desulfatibacillum sp.]